MCRAGFRAPHILDMEWGDVRFVVGVRSNPQNALLFRMDGMQSRDIEKKRERDRQYTLGTRPIARAS